jgi:AraC-like DNA-binding protein
MSTRRTRDITRFWHARAVRGLSCLEASFTTQRFPPHAHDAVVIAATSAGGAAYASRGRHGEADPSVLLVFNPTEPHAGHMGRSTSWRYRALYLGEEAIAGLLHALGRTALPGFMTNAIADPDLIAGFARAHRELDEDGDPALAREALIDACGRLFDRHASTVAPRAAPTDRPLVEFTLATIRQRFRERLTVDELAVAAGLSPFQLIRQVKRVTGMPPHAHLLRERLHEAIRQLEHGAALSDAAHAAGFYDQSAMTNAFRRTYGITPGQYVRAGHPLQLSPRP